MGLDQLVSNKLKIKKMCNDELGCPYCGTSIEPYDVMGDSDWDDQSFDWYKDAECPNCGKRFKIRQYDVEIVRHFEIEKDE